MSAGKPLLATKTHDGRQVITATRPWPSVDDAVRCPRCTGVVMVVNHLFAEHNRSVHGSADGR